MQLWPHSVFWQAPFFISAAAAAAGAGADIDQAAMELTLKAAMCECSEF